MAATALLSSRSQKRQEGTPTQELIPAETVLKDRITGEIILKKTTQIMALSPWPP